MRAGIRNTPRPSVTASNEMPDASWTAMTVTPGSTPPVESVTVPVSVASCAAACTGTHNRTAPITQRCSSRPIRNVIFPRFAGRSMRRRGVHRRSHRTAFVQGFNPETIRWRLGSTGMKAGCDEDPRERGAGRTARRIGLAARVYARLRTPRGIPAAASAADTRHCR